MRNTPKRNARVRAGARDKQIAAIWRSDFGAIPAPAQVQRLATAADVLHMPLAVLREAVRCAATTGAKSPMAYVLTLLQDWHYAGVRTADEVGEYAYLRDVVEGRQPATAKKRSRVWHRCAAAISRCRMPARKGRTADASKRHDNGAADSLLPVHGQCERGLPRASALPGLPVLRSAELQRALP